MAPATRSTHGLTITMRQLIGHYAIWLLLLVNPARLFQHINSLAWYRDMLRAWVDELALQPTQLILEVGCATGALTEYIAAQGMTATGVDAAATMIRRALAQPTRRGNYQVGDATQLAFATASFDAVLAASLLNIMATPEILLRELTRLCRAGGRVAVLVPQTGYGAAAITQFIRSNHLNGFSAAAFSFWQQHAPKMRLVAIAHLLRNAGLRNLTVTSYLNGMVIAVSGIKI
jgi:ubiquinone/menaquinone biosynthesis C-methylase UbiE